MSVPDAAGGGADAGPGAGPSPVMGDDPEAAGRSRSAAGDRAAEAGGSRGASYDRGRNSLDGVRHAGPAPAGSASARDVARAVVGQRAA